MTWWNISASSFSVKFEYLNIFHRTGCRYHWEQPRLASGRVIPDVLPKPVGHRERTHLLAIHASDPSQEKILERFVRPACIIFLA